MKKISTKLFSASLIMALALISLAGKAQTTSLAQDAATAGSTTVTTTADTKADTKTGEKEKITLSDLP